MGISTSVALEFEEEVFLLPPAVTLPLDITKFISRWTLGIPKSLMEFYLLSRQLRQQLDRLPSRTEEIPEDWILQSTKWSQKVLEILEDMHDVSHRLLANKPADLRGNIHPIEEYQSDISSTIDKFEKILRPLQHAKIDDKTEIAETLEGIRKIYLFSQIMKI